jgi:hypothetical protein
MKKKPWHSSEPKTQVYHDSAKCHVGNNIETENLEDGKGGKRLCSYCKRLH